MIFFDLDDTLLDHQTAATKAVLAVLAKATLVTAHTQKELLNLWREIAAKYYALYLQNQLTYKEQGRKRVKEFSQHLGVKLSNAEADQKFAHFLAEYDANWNLFADVLSTLEELKGRYPLGIISNGYYQQQILKLKKTNIANYFSDIVISSKYKLAKPDPKIFLTACNNNHQLPKNCVYVGDSWLYDIAPSYKLGFKSVWLKRLSDTNVNVEKLDTILCIRSLGQLPQSVRHFRVP